MRLAVVHSFYSSKQPSGENSVVLDQVEALEAAGHEVMLVARHTDQLESNTLYAPGSAFVVASGYGRSPARQLSDFRPDAIHLHNSFPNYGSRWLGKWGARTVATLHNYRTVCAAGTLFRNGSDCGSCLDTPVLPALRHACYRGSRGNTLPVAIGSAPGGGLRNVLLGAERLVVLNSAARKVIFDVTGRTAEVIPNFAPAPSTGQSNSRTGWTYAGRLTEEKGITRLLEHWPPDHQLDVFGSGPLEGALRARYGGRRDITFHGVVARPVLARRLAQSRALVLPSEWSEGLPTVVLEALALGVPIAISPRVAAASDLIASGVALALELPAPPASVADILGKLSRNEFRVRATALHRDRYSSAAWVAAMEEIYDGLAASA